MDAPTTSEHASTLASATTTRISAPPLVDARWLLEHIDTVRVIDTRRAAAHATVRVPDASSMPLDALVVEDTSRPAIGRLAIAAQTALAARGFAADDHVVLIDDADGSAALGAAICELAGMRHVSAVVGSGMDGWIAAGGDVAEGPFDVVDARPWHDIAPRIHVVAAFEDLVDAVVDGTACVVDARSQLEHEGIVGAPCCAGRGAIPGSVHVEWTAFFDMSGAVRPVMQVREIATHVGLDPNQPIIVTCHAGHRAAIAGRVLRSAGFRDVRISLGSWHEWSARGLGEDVDESHE